MSDSLSIIFAGTPDFAARHLTALINASCNIIGVLTQPDRPAGRGKQLMASPVKTVATHHSIPVFQPKSLRSEENQQIIAELHPDLMIVVAYGQILPEAVLNIPHLGCINVHGSLLPRWRGAAPIQRALWAGDTETGITIMQMDQGLDTGDMLCKLRCPIERNDTSATLYNKLSVLGPEGLLTTVTQLANGTAMGEKQNDHAACYAHKLTKEEAHLDWSLSASQLERCIRAFNPWPVSYLMIEKERIKVWQASVLSAVPESQPGEIIRADKNGIQVATGDGILNIEMLQPPGKKMMHVMDLLNSRREWFTPGNKLT